MKSPLTLRIVNLHGPRQPGGSDIITVQASSEEIGFAFTIQRYTLARALGYEARPGEAVEAELVGLDIEKAPLPDSVVSI